MLVLPPPPAPGQRGRDKMSGAAAETRFGWVEAPMCQSRRPGSWAARRGQWPPQKALVQSAEPPYGLPFINWGCVAQVVRRQDVNCADTCRADRERARDPVEHAVGISLGQRLGPAVRRVEFPGCVATGRVRHLLQLQPQSSGAVGTLAGSSKYCWPTTTVGAAAGVPPPPPRTRCRYRPSRQKGGSVGSRRAVGCASRAAPTGRHGSALPPGRAGISRPWPAGLSLLRPPGGGGHKAPPASPRRVRRGAREAYGPQPPPTARPCSTRMRSTSKPVSTRTPREPNSERNATTNRPAPPATTGRPKPCSIRRTRASSTHQRHAPERARHATAMARTGGRLHVRGNPGAGTPGRW